MSINSTIGASEDELLCFVNCQIFHVQDEDQTPCLQSGKVLVNVTEGVIVSITIQSGENDDNCNLQSSSSNVEIVNCCGHILAPGFIDIQLNGAFGVDFSSPDLTKEKVDLVSERLPRYGVTSFCPTLISSTPQLYKRNIPLIGESAKENLQILGIHLEGPFFQPSQKGAHALGNIVAKMDTGKSDYLLEEIYGNNNLQQHVCLVTLAPELPGATSVIKLLVEKYRIVVSMGHTISTLEQGEKAVQNGAACLTHIFNAMTPIHHRRPGIIGLLCSQSRIKYGVIADGIHVHPTAVNMAFRMNPSGIILVTDAMAALGLENGSQIFLGNQAITVKNEKAILTGTKDTLAGSIISMDACVQNLYKFTDCSKAQAIAAATFRPAQLLETYSQKIGQIKSGYLANLVLLDFDNLKLRGTWVKGIQHCF